MRAAFVVLTWSLGAGVALQPPIHAQAADSRLPVSPERIRAALERPPLLLDVPVPVDTPTFHVSVQQPFFELQPIEDRPFDPTFGLPSAGELLTSGIGKIASAVVHYRRRRAERRAQKEVDDALAAFCAVRDCAGAAGRRAPASK